MKHSPDDNLVHSGALTVTACQSVAATGRAHYVVTSPAESCGRQLTVLTPLALLSLPFDALLYTSEHKDLDLTLFDFAFYFEHRQYPVPDCNPRALSLSQIQW